MKKSNLWKVLCGILVVVFVVSCTTLLVACGDKDKDKDNTEHTHEFGEWKVTKEATCTEAGSKERECACGEKETEAIAALGHDFVDGVCSRCGDKESTTPAHTHEFGEWTVTKEATCTESGSKERACACGEKEGATIAALGHDYVDGVCSRCGAQDPNAPEVDLLKPAGYVVPTVKEGRAATANGTLVVGYNFFNEKFSPFFATSSYDVDVAGLTQVGLLASDRGGNIIYNGIEGEVVPYNGTDYTYYGIADIKVTQNLDGTVDYTIYLAKGVKFSDGTPLTVKDVLFSMYVFSDVDYDGSTTFYSLPIEGMSEWRTNLKGDVYAKYMAIAEAVLATFDTESGEFNYVESTSYTKAQYDSLVAAIKSDTGAWKALAQDIVSYCVSKYASYAGGGNKYSGKGLNLKEDAQTIALGMSMWGFGSFGSEYSLDAEKGNVGLVDGNYKNLWTITEEEGSFKDSEGNAYARVSSAEQPAFLLGAKNEDGTYNVIAYDGDRYSSVFTAIFTDSNGNVYDTEKGEFPTIQNYVECLKAAYEENLYDAISVEHANLEFDGYVATVIEPWVADAGKADMNGESINSISGITYNEDTQIINVHTTEFSATTIYQLSLSVAPMHYYGDTSLWDPDNGSYGFTRGNLDGVRSKTRNPMGAGPYVFKEYKDGIVSFEANASYWEGSPKIKNVKFQEMADADKLPAITKGDIDVAVPSLNDGTIKQIKEANGNYDKLEIKEGLKVSTDLVDFNGYGYLGINADNVLVGTDKASDASKNLRKAFMTLFAAYREYTVNSYYHERASVIQYPITNCSWAAPQPADEGYAIAFSTDVDGKAIYTADMGEEARWAAAKAACIGFFKAAGYTWDETAGKFTAAPDGAKMVFEVIIGGDGTGDHPTYGLLLKCQDVLDSIGIKLDITDDSDNLFDRMEDGSVDMFVAAWGASSDPDMYQIYHSDNKTGSNHYRIADTELDELIMEARTSADKNFRKATYKDCLDIILDWAVELPVYQRKECTVFNGDSVNVNTITPDTTPFWRYLAEIHNLEVK